MPTDLPVFAATRVHRELKTGQRIGRKIENSAGFGDRSDTVCEDVERRSFDRRPFDIRTGHARFYREYLRRLGVIHVHAHHRGNAAKNAAGENRFRIQDEDPS